MKLRSPRCQATHGLINVPPTPLEEASKFVKLVKEYNGEVYDRFHEILLDYKEQRSDVYGTLSRLEQLFMDHSELRLRFSSLQNSSSCHQR